MERWPGAVEEADATEVDEGGEPGPSTTSYRLLYRSLAENLAVPEAEAGDLIARYPPGAAAFWGLQRGYGGDRGVAPALDRARARESDPGAAADMDRTREGH